MDSGFFAQYRVEKVLYFIVYKFICFFMVAVFDYHFKKKKKTPQGGYMSVVVHSKPDVNTLLFKTSHLHIHDKGVFVVYLFYWLGCVISIAFEEYTKQV